MIEERGEYIRFLNGEVLVFKHFFKEHFPKFFAFTSRFIDDSYVREDIVQETFIIVWSRHLKMFDSEVALQAFIYRTLRNKCLDYIRHEKIKERYSSEYSKERETSDYLMQAIIDEESRFLIHKAIKSLTPQVQAVIKLHLEGKRNKEIAEEMGISETTVKFHKSVAYKELNKSLGHLFLMITMLS